MNKRSEKLIDVLIEIKYKGEIINITDGINGWKKNGFEIVIDLK